MCLLTSIFYNSYYQWSLLFVYTWLKYNSISGSWRLTCPAFTDPSTTIFFSFPLSSTNCFQPHGYFLSFEIFSYITFPSRAKMSYNWSRCYKRSNDLLLELCLVHANWMPRLLQPITFWFLNIFGCFMTSQIFFFDFTWSAVQNHNIIFNNFFSKHSSLLLNKCPVFIST